MNHLRLPLLLLLGALLACNRTPETTEAAEATKDNQELRELYQADQADRMSGNSIDWSVVSRRDSTREARVYELLDSGQIRTGADYYHAAMIFQHGGDTVASGMAVQMMRQAIAKDSSVNKWLLAAAIDRDLMRKKQPQIYGTQYVKASQDTPWRRYDIDTTQVTDEERQAYHVETLAEQRMKVKLMNKHKLSERLAEGESMDDIVGFIREEDIDQSDYDLSEGGINAFGYELMAQQRYEEALQVFELNTELYPEGFNTYDSYGEGLLGVGRRAEAIKAYEKSLLLNPNNTHAEEVLAKLLENR